MKFQLRNRIKAGVMAFALTFAQIVVPAAPVFATSNSGTLKVHEKETTEGTPNSDPKVCVFNFEAFGLNSNQTGDVKIETQSGTPEITSVVVSLTTDADGDGETEYINDVGSSVNLSDGHYKATLDNKFGTDVGDKAKSKVFKVECGEPTQTSVTAVSGSFVDGCGPTFNAAFNATATTGVTYNTSVNGNTITVTATADANYALSNPSFTQTYTDMLVACPPEDKSATAVNGTFSDVCGDLFNLSFTAATTEGVTYSQVKDGNTITITAIAQSGYVLSDPNWSQTQTDLLVACPVIKPCTTNTMTMVSKYEDFADYNYTRATGHTDFTADGLHIWTEGATSTDKVAWYNLVTPYSLSEIGTPSFEYTNTAGGIPGMQILFDKDGNGTSDAILVGEPSAYGDRWWSNATGLGVSAGDGYNSSATLQEYLNANPNSQVIGVGFSLGSGVKGDGVLKSLTFGCQTWEFKKAVSAPTQCTVRDNLYIEPWTIDREQFPSAGGNGSFAFMSDGLHLSTPLQGSYVYGLMDAGNTPIRDIDDMSYMTYRDVTSSGDPQIVSAYILYVDLDGDLTTDDGTYLFYEPIYNGTVQTGVWQTWDVDADDAKFWSSSLSDGNPSLTWAGLVSAYPNAVATNYGFNQGTYNQGTNARIQNVVFDCATTVFGVPGSGGEEEPEVPVVPVVPATPSVPVTPSTPVGGQGSLLPEELPMTGENGSIVFTWIALLAAILTYGAVYYLQPKKRFEQ